MQSRSQRAAEKFEQGDVETGDVHVQSEIGSAAQQTACSGMMRPDKRRAIDKAELSFYTHAQEDSSH